MQDDKVLFTEKVPAGKRTYFLDVVENFKGHKYLKFTESRANDGQYIGQSLRIFQEDFDKIFNALDSVKGYLDANHVPVAPPVREEKQEERNEKPEEKKDEDYGDLSF